jgi:hypothetical protein
MTRSRSIPTHFEAPVGEHSMKLEKFYDIVREAPFLPTGEAFQRKGRHGSLICLRTRRSCWRQRSKGQRDHLLMRALAGHTDQCAMIRRVCHQAACLLLSPLSLGVRVCNRPPNPGLILDQKLSLSAFPFCSRNDRHRHSVPQAHPHLLAQVGC